MNEILIQQGENKVAIALLSEETEDLPSKGHLYLRIKISSNGYSGENDLWVLGYDFKEFCKALTILNEERKGEAVLYGMSPHELEIRICSVSQLGHLAVCGFTGHEVLGENHTFEHQVTFGFEIDPTQLEKMVNSKWVRDSALMHIDRPV